MYVDVYRQDPRPRKQALTYTARGARAVFDSPRLHFNPMQSLGFFILIERTSADAGRLTWCLLQPRRLSRQEFVALPRPRVEGLNPRRGVPGRRCARSRSPQLPPEPLLDPPQPTVDGRAVDAQLVGDGLSFEAGSVPGPQKGAVAAGYRPLAHPARDCPGSVLPVPRRHPCPTGRVPAHRPEAPPDRPAARTPHRSPVRGSPDARVAAHGLV
jgi:hypothetical protein